MIVLKGVLKSLKQNIFQLFGSIILLALSVMLFLMLQTAIGSVAKSNEAFIKNNHQEDFQFYTAAPLKSETLKKLAQQYHVTLSERTFMDKEWGKEGTLRLLSFNQIINIPHLETGSLPAKRDELALFKGFAAANHYKAGDEITLSGKVYKITGIVYLPDYIYPVKNEADLSADPKTFGIAAASDSALKSLEKKPGFYYMGEITADSYNKEGLKKAVLKEAPILKWTDRKDNPRISFVDAKIKSSESIVTAFPLLIAAIVMLMTMLIINRKLKHQQKQIGTLLAMGYFPSEISKAYMLYPLFVSLAGSVIGAVLGILLSVPMTAYYTSYFNIPLLSPMSIDFSGIVISFFAPLILLSFAGYLAVRKTVNQPVLALLSSGGSKKRKREKNFQLKGSFMNRFRMKMLLNNPSKGAVLFIGIALCSALVMFGFLTMNSVDSMIKKTYVETYRYNYAFYFSRPEVKTPSLNESPFTLVNASVSNTEGKKSNKELPLYGIMPDNKMIVLRDETGEALNKKVQNGAILTKAAAASLKVKKGDKVAVKNSWSEKEVILPVAAIADIDIGNALYWDKQKMNKYLGLPDQAYLGKWTIEKPPVTEQGILSVEDKNAAKKAFDEALGPLKYSIVLISFFSFVIGFIMIRLITGLMIEESITSISLLKVIGYDDRRISKMVLNIYLPVVLLGYLVGVPAAIFSLKALLSSVAESAGLTLPVAVNPFMIAGSLFIILITYWISMALSKRKVEKVPLQEVLKKQE